MKLTFSKPLHKGFTLIELMIVIAIIAILATIAIPSYQNYTKKRLSPNSLQASAPYKSDVDLCIYSTNAPDKLFWWFNGIAADITTAKVMLNPLPRNQGVITYRKWCIRWDQLFFNGDRLNLIRCYLDNRLPKQCRFIPCRFLLSYQIAKHGLSSNRKNGEIYHISPQYWQQNQQQQALLLRYFALPS